MSSRCLVTSPRQRTAKPGPGNGCRHTSILRQAQFHTESADFVLKQIPQGLDQFKPKFLGQTADVVVQLDRGRRTVKRSTAFNHVGIERALSQEFAPSDVVGLLLKAFDECVPDAASFFLGFGHSAEFDPGIGLRP